MPTVVVEPSGIVLEVRRDEPVMRAAERLGYTWPTTCHGEASCKVCVLEVRGDPEALAPMSRLERSALERTFPSMRRGDWPLRLACQATPVRDVVVFKRGVRSAEPPRAIP